MLYLHPDSWFSLWAWCVRFLRRVRPNHDNNEVYHSRGELLYISRVTPTDFVDRSGLRVYKWGALCASRAMFTFVDGSYRVGCESTWYKRGTGRLPNPSRETKFSGANADREMFIFPVQLTTSSKGNLARLIHTLVMCVTVQDTALSRQKILHYYSVCVNSPIMYCW